MFKSQTDLSFVWIFEIEICLQFGFWDLDFLHRNYHSIPKSENYFVSSI
jgi:hypothetical protein